MPQGCFPDAPLLQCPDGALYGTTQNGGDGDYGIIFKIGTDGSGWTALHSFTGANGDGSTPHGALLLASDGMLYGTTADGGTNGTVFKLNTDGTGFTVLHYFPGSFGAGDNPLAGLIQDKNGMLYGTTIWGGAGLSGTVFKLNTNGTDYAVLRVFGRSIGDGVAPVAGLLQGNDGMLYGTTQTTVGSTNTDGLVFKLDTNGVVYTVLHRFMGGPAEGSRPYSAPLIQDHDGVLYGTTQYGGAAGAGTIFKLNPDGTGFTVLRSFGGADGGNVPAGLIQATDGALYGTTEKGGAAGAGTAFRTGTDGAGYTVLYNFGQQNGHGRTPLVGLTQGADGALYGTTLYGGTTGAGTLFRLAPLPPAFSAIEPLADGNFRLTLSGASNTLWRVEVAPSLHGSATWTLLTNVTTSIGSVQFNDLDATNHPVSFYRAVWPAQ